ncbi:MAG: purine-binding chemotaxis protein CheW, partial [Kiritimatiellia bacterium]
EWFMGLQKTLIGNINVINTTQFVMPERYDKSAENAFKFNVAINGSGWGLAVDDIDQPIAINPDDIRWRVNRAQQPWMAGTVKEHMCVLLDIPTLAEMFTKKHNRHEPELASD